MSKTTEYYASKANLSSLLTKIDTKLNNRYTKDEVDTIIGGITEIDISLGYDDDGTFVPWTTSNLPATGTKGTIYLVRNASQSGTNLYDEYIWVPAVGQTPGRYENLGPIDVDLTNYVNSIIATGPITATRNSSDDNEYTIALALITNGGLKVVSDELGVKYDNDTIKINSNGELYADIPDETEVLAGNGISVSQGSTGNESEWTVTAKVKANSGISVTANDGLSANIDTNDLQFDSSTGAIKLATAVRSSIDDALKNDDIQPIGIDDMNDLLALITDDPE